MALDKSKLQAKMLASSATAPAIPKVIPTNLTPTPTKPNARTGERPNATPLKAVPKQKQAKGGGKKYQRYSFEITPELKDQLEVAVLEHKLKTRGKNISNSAVIRTALAKYLKGGKL